MEAGAIVGIVLGSVALLLIVGFLAYSYWWKPYQNKTRHTAGKLDTEFDERTRRQLMETYGITDENLQGNSTVVDDLALRMDNNPYEFTVGLP
mgnify:FL=1